MTAHSTAKDTSNDKQATETNDGPSTAVLTPAEVIKQAEGNKKRYDELVAWKKAVEQENEFKELLVAQEIYNRGENPFPKPRGEDNRSETIQPDPSPTRLKLPDPEKPTKLNGSSRANWQQWSADCEDWFGRGACPTESEKVHFACGYMTPGMKKLWRAWLDNQRKLKGEDFLPTWAETKSEVLNFKSSSAVRATEAFDKIAQAKQGDRSPIELRNYMTTYWDELGEENEFLKKEAYLKALDPEIRQSLRASGTIRQSSTMDVALLAQEIWADLQQNRRQEKRKRDDEPNTDTESNASMGNRKGNREKRRKNGKHSHKQRKQPAATNDDQKKSSEVGNKDKDKSESRPGVQCYYCGKFGHIKRDCRKFQADLTAGKVKEDTSGKVQATEK